MVVNRVGHTACDVGHDREWRVHQHHGRDDGAVEMIVDLGGVEARGGDVRKEEGEKLGTRLGQLVEDERAACGLAQSGMLSERQRRTAVPRLLEFAEDLSLDGETRKWVFQALRDITGQTLAHDASAWRRWYSAKSSRWNPVTRDGG